MLASAALGPALPSEDDTDTVASLPPLHLIVLVDLPKGSGGKGYYPYSALIDSDAHYNFISKCVTDKLRFEVVKARRTKVMKKALPPVTIVNGELLRVTAIIQQIVQICDSTGTILGMESLKKHNSDIH
jgi:hypothetical protein